MGGGCVVGWAVGMAAAALLSGCVTINIYFPAAAAEKAADKIIDEVWRPQKPPTSPPGDTAPGRFGSAPTQGSKCGLLHMWAAGLREVPRRCRSFRLLRLDRE